MLSKVKNKISNYSKKWFYGGGLFISRLFGFGTSGRVNDGWAYDVYAWAGYMSNPIVYRCVNLISESVSGIPFRLYRRDAEGKKVQIKEAPILDLLSKPNPFLCEKDFFAQFVQYLQISGNVYIKEARPSRDGATPKELYFLRPDQVNIRTDNVDCLYGDGIIYEYNMGRNKEIIDRKKFYHGKLFNPLCDLYGLSPLMACATSVDQLNEALQWNVSLLKNSASPSLIVTSENTFSDDQIDQLREQNEKKNQGVWNSGSIFYASGDMNVQKLGMSPKEMDWIDGIKLASKNITLTYGVDPQLGGDSDHRSYNTYKDAEKSFYIGTVLPILDKIKSDFLDRWLIPRFYGDNSDYFFEYDLDAIEVLAETRHDMWERLSDAVQAGIITVNEARQDLGYEELDQASMNEQIESTEE